MFTPKYDPRVLPTTLQAVDLPDNLLRHFCSKEGCDTIYVVEPDAPKKKAVYPIAANFPEFMGLVVACNHASVLWQAQDLSRKEFDALVQKNKPYMQQRSVLRAIGNIYHPPVIADPYGYMKNLRK